MVDDGVLGMIQQRLEAAQNILVVSHVRPDGDAIGSLLGFGLALEAAGKQVQMVLADRVPPQFRNLTGVEHIRHASSTGFDFTCTLDCSDLQRTGNALQNVEQPDLNIDHHSTNLQFAKINLVDVEAVATAEILAELISALHLPLPRASVEALLTGLITDTLGFSTSNMTPKALRLAADLMELGGNLTEIYRYSLLARSFAAMRFWGAGLCQLEREGRLVWTTLSLNDRRTVGYPGKDDADLINELASIDDADVALVFVEQANERVKVSWRAQPGFDVSHVALHFGGGGHPAASGAEISGRLEEVRSVVLQVTQSILGVEKKDGKNR